MIVTTVSLICDRCEEENDAAFPTAREMRAYAATQGWVRRHRSADGAPMGSGLHDLCLKCATPTPKTPERIALPCQVCGETVWVPAGSAIASHGACSSRRNRKR